MMMMMLMLLAADACDRMSSYYTISMGHQAVQYLDYGCISDSVRDPVEMLNGTRYGNQLFYCQYNTITE